MRYQCYLMFIHYYWEDGLQKTNILYLALYVELIAQTISYETKILNRFTPTNINMNKALSPTRWQYQSKV